MSRSLRIAILAHSTNPRGGVVHALELGDALTRLGHEAVVHAPDAKGTGFFRPSLCETLSVPASPVGADVTEMVRIRAADYVRHFEHAANRRFDVFHAQDGISGNALATLKQRGLIPRFARTVHHVDTFRDPELLALQQRAIVEADRHFVVSRLWQDLLAEMFALGSTIVGNGVDVARFSPVADGREEALKARLGVGDGPVVLSVGGVEERKNTHAHARGLHPAPRAASQGAARHRRRRLGARPSPLSGGVRRHARRLRPAGRRRHPHRRRAAGPTCRRSTASPTCSPSPR